MVPANTTTSAFAHCHPAVGLLYFTLLLLGAMCLTHPACLTASILCALLYARLLYARSIWRQAAKCLPLLLLAAGVNPLFNHRGVTVIGHFPNGNPLTLESIYYGIAAAGLLAAVLLWFLCCTKVLTADKLLWLFGRVLPTLGSTLTMAVGFLPRFRTQWKRIRMGQAALGQLGTTRPQTLKRAVDALSILITWALEHALTTASSMKARGYGLPHPTSFSPHQITGRDKALLLWLGFWSPLMVMAWVMGGFSARYWPTLSFQQNIWTVLGLLAYTALGLAPSLLEGKEAWTWRLSRYET